MPASARITPDEVWALWQEMSAGSGYNLKAEKTSTAKGALTLENVTLEFEQDQVRGESQIDTLVLKQVGDTVEFTLPGVIWFDTTVTADKDEDPVRMRTAIGQNGYLAKVSGSAAAPQFDFTAERLTVENTVLSEEADSLPKTTVELRDLSGKTEIRSRAPLEFEQTAHVARLISRTDVKLSEEEGGDFSNTLEIEDLTGSHRGKLPVEVAPGTSVAGLFGAGAEGTGKFTTGALRNRIEAAENGMVPPATVAIDSTGFDYDLSGAKFRFGFDLKGIDAAKAEADLVADSTTAITAKGDFTIVEGDGLAEGLPNTEGTLHVTYRDVNPFLERLVASGLLPQDQMMAAQFMMALFARPGVEPNVMETVIELKEDGQVIANGQRVQ